MSTNEFRTPDAGHGLPLSTQELSRLASQIYAEVTPLSVRPGAAPPGVPGGVAGTPPQTTPVAPRGSFPGTNVPAAYADFAVTSLELGPSVAYVVPDAPATAPAPIAPVTGTPAPYRLGSIPAPWLSPQVPQFGGARPDVAVSERAEGRSGTEVDAVGLEGPAAEFDVATIRTDFPILAETVNGHPLIWFDNAATTQKPQAVIDSLAHFYAHETSNIHRAAHELAARATDAYEDARNSVRDFLGAGRSEEIIFVRGATEGINLVAQAWGRKNLHPGDEILISHLEHHANIVPWQIVAQQTGAVLKVAPVDSHGNLMLDGFSAQLGPRTKLVAVTQVANAIGTVTPVATLTRLAHQAGARVLIDGAQSVPHLRVNLQELDPDFFVFSGHKVFCPTGIGALYISERVWDETPTWQGGGNMIADVTHERSIYQGAPNKYEAGTGNIADAVGLAAALRYVEKVGIERIAAYEHHLLEYATSRITGIPGVRIIGTADEKASVLSFVLEGHEPEEVGRALNTRGIAVRAGHHCAQPILRRLGVEQTVRPSFAFYNTEGEIDVFVQALRDIANGTLRGHARG
ncbi:cysteine desulfurase [Ruaniaceae bacterium KH17]|nr:cysteine desulfurase [Ruaniaceae bacterium KH17]